jgi:hypothetical protein
MEKMKIQKNNFENSILNSTPVMSLRAANIFQGFRKTEGKKWMKERKKEKKKGRNETKSLNLLKPAAFLRLEIFFN